MTTLSQKQAGLSLGLLCAGMHFIWVVLVATGFAPVLINAMARAHFIAFQYATVSVDLWTAVAGVIGAFATGFILGGVFALLWNIVGEYL